VSGAGIRPALLHSTLFAKIAGGTTLALFFFKSLNIAAAQAAGKSKTVCHSERSEESLFDLSIRSNEILGFAQNDKIKD
jgi:hypothetical protein